MFAWMTKERCRRIRPTTATLSRLVEELRTDQNQGAHRRAPTNRTDVNLRDEFVSLSETIESSASAETVYSTPIERNGRTVVPIARVEFGLGGGAGGGGGGGGGAGGGGSSDEDDAERQGGGLGGGFSARPAGALEVTERRTRFVEPTDRGRSAKLPIAGIVFGLVVGSLIRYFGSDR